MEEQPEKVTMRLHPEKHLAGWWDSCVASEPRGPGEASVGTLCAGNDHVRGAWRSGDGRRYADINPLVSHKLSTGASVLSASPIPRSRSGAGPTWRGWSNTLTCLGFFVAFPSH